MCKFCSENCLAVSHYNGACKTPGAEINTSALSHSPGDGHCTQPDIVNLVHIFSILYSI